MRPNDEIVKRQLNPFDDFQRIASRNISDLRKLREQLKLSNLLKNDQYIPNVDIKLANTKANIDYCNKFDLLVSSPPYGDNHTTVTYGQHSYLPLNWIDLDDLGISAPYDYLVSTREIDSQSLGGKAIDFSNEEIEELFSCTPSLFQYYSMLTDEDRRKAKKLLFFTNDLKKAIDVIVESLNVNSLSVWTIGNRHIAGKEVPNDKILTEILENNGLNKIVALERCISGKRMPFKNIYSKTMSKEKILVFRKTL
jgi:hypothetical protein